MTVLASDTEGSVAATEAAYSASLAGGTTTALTTIGSQITSFDVPATADYARFAARAFAELVHFLNLAAGTFA